MNLLELRKHFRSISGRYDLVNDDFSDNGANFFINEGSKWLDRTFEHQKSWAQQMQILPTGSWYATFPNCRAIKEVWLATSDGRWQLEKKRLQDLLATYHSQLPSLITNGSPDYYSPAITRYIPENITPLTLASFAAFIGLISPAPAHDYNAIILSVPVDKDTLVEIHGLFYSQLFTLDADTNFWSVVHPLLLIKSAIRQSFATSGNVPMLKIYDEDIKGDLVSIGMDLVEEMIAEADQMEG